MNFKLHTFNGVQYTLPEPLTPVKVLGSGTFGLVIRATSPHYEKPVAIKIIRDTLGTAKEKANAFREIDILKTVRHQNIIVIQDSFIFGQDVYIQTESLDSDLKMVLDSDLIISEPNMLKMMKQIVSAVAYLHGICIMNRDLKPANILVDISTFHVKLSNYPNGPTTTTIANNYPNPGPIATTAANNYPGPGPIAPITTNYPGPAPTTTCTSSVNGNNNGNGNSGNNGYIYGNAGTGNSTQPKKWWSSANRVMDNGVTVGLLVMASILF
ncbi:hypothetical protein HDU99_006263 [Rhizoclosmatium hyalinum]|nr:hypothetical protein HDU99_006263 [Rhizoclosmatium hyalinum]